MPIPRVKTEATNVESPKSKCGDNWDKNVKIRNPYKGVDKFVRSLLSLAEADLVSERDDGIVGQLEWERARVKKMRGDHKSVLNSEQRKNIDAYLERAQLYIKDATKIQNLWASGFATAGYGVVEILPININVSDIGNGFCMNKPPGYRAKGQYEFNCPKLEEVQGHQKDADKWGILIVAAMKNIRCAEEVIRKAEVLRLNKIEWEKTAPKPQIETTGIIRAAEPAVEPQPIPTDPAAAAGTPVAGGLVGGGMPSGSTGGTGVVSFDPSDDLPTSGEPLVADEEDMGEGVLEDEYPTGDVEGPDAPKKKKKGKGALIAAAGIGALLLFR